jgi:hypothetical protein
MTQEIRALSAEDAAHVEKRRTWVRDHYDADARHHYETVEGKLRLLHTIVRSGWIAPNEKWKLQSLGVTFGDALAQRMGLSWVTVEDEYGSDPALQDQGTTIVVFPLTTISKRIERGDAINIQELFDQACRTITRLRDELKGA